MWGALIYAVFGTALTQWIGSPLVNLDFQQQRYEADFRFNLVRVRENSEQIALLQGERAERERLSERFGRVVDNWYGIMSRTKRLTAFTASYSQAAVVFPYILVAPAYFADKIQLGGMMQTASAFASVQKALSFFVSIYRTLAEWRAVVARLDGFEMAIASAAAWQTRPARSASCRAAGSDEIELRAAAGAAAQRRRRWSRPTASACAAASGRWSPARPAPASRPCSAPSPASGRSAAARSRSLPTRR